MHLHILQVCAAEGIPVHLRPPLLREVDTWEGAFITSTSRLLLPLHELVYPAPPPHQSAAADLDAAHPQQQQQHHREQQLSKVGDTCLGLRGVY
jgi:branched-subunit amino acid aminotransferase/4-amino-4-deoxychorismate lyase